MTQREQIAALQDEVAELRKQLSMMAVAMAELAAKQPVQYVPYVYPTWPQHPSYPWTWTYTSPNTCTATLSDGTAWTSNGGVA